MIQEQIKVIEARLEWLKTDTTKWVSAFAQPDGCTPYNHGNYFRKLERNRLKTMLKRLQKKLLKNQDPIIIILIFNIINKKGIFPQHFIN